MLFKLGRPYLHAYKGHIANSLFLSIKTFSLGGNNSNTYSIYQRGNVNILTIIPYLYWGFYPTPY